MYIAASGPLHCLDGWGYFGRACQALAQGDMGVATHLGYYAELRAAMALLATVGIGIFADKHIVLKRGRRSWDVVRYNGSKTHTFAWEALAAWAGTTSAQNTILSVLQANGIPLGRWLEEFGATGATRQLWAGNLTKQLGMDLDVLSLDKDARNLASYRPTALEAQHPFDTREAVLFLSAVWRAFEPGHRGSAPNLDGHILRASISLVFQQLHVNGRSPKQAGRDYARRVEKMLAGLGLDADSVKYWVDFLLSQHGTGGCLLVDRAFNKQGPTCPSHPFDLLSRAALLLHVSSCFCRGLLSMENDRDDLEFWWGELGISRGMWQPDAPPESMRDLWADVQEAVHAIEQLFKGGGDGLSLYDLNQQHRAELATLGTCERIGLWGML